MLPLILPTHPNPIPRPLPPLPKPTRPLLPHQTHPTSPAILRSIILLSRAEPTDHPIRPLIDMFLRLIMTLITRVNLLATAESKPAVTLGIMSALASPRKLGTRRDAKSFFLPARTGRRRRAGGG